MLQLMLRHTHNTLLDWTRNAQDVLSSIRRCFSLSWCSCSASWHELGELLGFSGCGVEASSEDAAAAAASLAQLASIWNKKSVCVSKVAGRDVPDIAFQRQALRNNTCVRLQAELSTLPPQVLPHKAVRDYSLSQPAVLDTVRGKEQLEISPRPEDCIHQGQGQLVQKLCGSPCSPEQTPQKTKRALRGQQKHIQRIAGPPAKALAALPRAAAEIQRTSKCPSDQLRWRPQ